MRSPSADDRPRGVERHGDAAGLARRKPHFRDEMQRNDLGSLANQVLLNELKPRALVLGAPALQVRGFGGPRGRRKAPTRFLALDKCLRAEIFYS